MPLNYAIIESECDGRGFSCVSWHKTNEEAHKATVSLIAEGEQYGECLVLYVVDSEQFNRLNRLESSGMLQLA